MEKFIKELRNRKKLLIWYCVLGVVLSVAARYLINSTITAKTSDFIPGMFSGFIGVAMVLIYQYSSALKNENKLKKLYLAENDERNKFIEAKIGGMGINVIIAGITLFAIIAGYMNETVFFTLIGVALFVVLVKSVLKIIYNKKY